MFSGYDATVAARRNARQDEFSAVIWGIFSAAISLAEATQGDGR
jgi:hypothetical protein